jgi:hypothetical protein
MRHTCFGHVTRPLAHVMCLMLASWEVMGAKHDKVKTNRAKGRLRGKICGST